MLGYLPALRMCCTMCRGVSIDWPTTSKILSSQPRKFFDLLSGYPFSKGLPTLNSLRDPVTVQVFKMAIAHDGIYKASLRTGSKEFKYALRDIWRNGWLHAVESKWDIRYIFASQIHRCPITHQICRLPSSRADACP
ncbi:unnamed protein product [Aspergillus oryzae RIB40]|uniref:DNA, SC005 n=1 Tax=Aspergillus oryzae (strain ATCC 42149 / RIB 40) TaxID=510516 RepID=Q2UTC2_ASPOR|nr:unnamed protein product [Aspergillus oryzae RIB40]BAE55193.1 unnamed protein product [Aspergillus oryzae RIB40]